MHDFKETGVRKFNWRDYNRSQTQEKLIFVELLKELLKTVDKSSDQYLSKGNKNYYNQIFPMCLKVYLNTSGRRMMSDLKMYKDLGYINKLPHFNSVLNYFKNPNLKIVLKHLIELSSLPLAQIERNFAVDASGIGAHQFEPWINIRSKHNEHRKYLKVHIIYGVLSNIATSCVVTKGTAADSPHFENLLRRTAKNFNVEEVSADLAYSSKHNLQVASDIGAVPYIPYKVNATGKGLGIWAQMFIYFKEHEEEYMRHYHKRSNAETGFWMIKKKFGEYVSAKGEVAQENEILCKVLCHNLCCLVQEIFLQRIKVDFNKEFQKYSAQTKVL